MNEDRIEGSARTIGGKMQEAAGRLTGDAKTRVEGEVNQAAGHAQNLYGQARDAAADAVGAIEDGAETVEDAVRDFVETRPYDAAIALGHRPLIGTMSQPSIPLVPANRTCAVNVGHSVTAANGRRRLHARDGPDPYRMRMTRNVPMRKGLASGACE